MNRSKPSRTRSPKALNPKHPETVGTGPQVTTQEETLEMLESHGGEDSAACGLLSIWGLRSFRVRVQGVCVSQMERESE